MYHTNAPHKRGACGFMAFPDAGAKSVCRPGRPQGTNAAADEMISGVIFTILTPTLAVFTLSHMDTAIVVMPPFLTGHLPQRLCLAAGGSGHNPARMANEPLWAWPDACEGRSTAARQHLR